MNRYFLYILLCILFVFLTGCSALLPSARQTTKSPWTSFDEAKDSFDRITLYATTRDDLKKTWL